MSSSLGTKIAFLERAYNTVRDLSWDAGFHGLWDAEGHLDDVADALFDELTEMRAMCAMRAARPNGPAFPAITGTVQAHWQ